jgi:NADH-quinone oxidoreductase subunit J
MTPDLVVFFLLAIVAIGAALGMLLSRNAVHSALFLVLVMAVISVFFLVLAAPFIAMAQVTVYAGAIMVLFLFVIMLLGAEAIKPKRTVLPWQPWLAGVLGVLFVTALGYMVFVRAVGLAPGGLAAVTTPIPNDFGGPKALGLELFHNYLLPFELTSFLLLVGMIGAVVLTRDARETRGRQPVSNPSSKLAALPERRA